MSYEFPSHLFRGLELESAAVFIMDRFWTHEQGLKTRDSREIFPREGIGVMDNVGLLFQGPRGILGAFSGLQIAQD